MIRLFPDSGSAIDACDRRRSVLPRLTDMETLYPNCKIDVVSPRVEKIDGLRSLAGRGACDFPCTLAPLATASARVALKLGT